MPAADLPASRAHAKAALRARLRASRIRRTDAAGAAFAAGGLALASGGDVVALYASVAGEPDTRPLIAALHRAGVRVLLPVLAGRRTPDWAWYAGPEALRPGWHGILEPATPALGAEGLAAASVVFCSALATTPAGDRLGGGGGWYDRALARASVGAIVVALCFDDEVLDAVPTDPWDRRVDAILTERRTLRAGASGAE